MIQGFKDFISRGNAIDLAVGMIVGAAFTGVVTALVDKVLDPLIAGLVGEPNFDSVLAFTIGLGNAQATVQPGAVLTALVNFLLVALALYVFIVAPMNMWNERREAEREKRDQANKKAAEDAPEAADVQLLREIRDMLAAGAPRE